MKKIMMRGKIHGAKVTDSNLDYEGSLSLDETLMTAADMVPYEQVHIYNKSNGERFLTYLIKAEKDSGVVGVNGAASHKADVGHELIIVSYGLMQKDEIEFFTPRVVIVDEKNQILKIKK
jgi:aspartate 1-decarboxylase